MIRQLGNDLRAIARDWRVIGLWAVNLLLLIVLIAFVDGTIARNHLQENSAASVRASEQSARSAQDATKNAIDSRDRATRRIDLLQADIARLTHEVQVAAAAQAEASTQSRLLAQQVRGLGGRPVVVQPGPTSTTTSTTFPPLPPTTTTTPQRVVQQQVTTTVVRAASTTTTTRATTTTTRRVAK